MTEPKRFHPLAWIGVGAAAMWGVSRVVGKPTRSRNPSVAASKPSQTTAAVRPAPVIQSPSRPPISTPAASVALGVIGAPASSGGAPPNHPATQSTPTPGESRTAADPLTRQFDFIFAAEGEGLPVAYLRALAWGESRLNPLVDRGLFQIADITRADFAARHKRSIPRVALRDPRLCTAIAADTLIRIKSSLATNHPQSVNAREDWSNRLFVELLTFAWNTGWSESRGVGGVLGYLEARGVTTATIDDIHAHAREAGAVAWLHAYPARVAWARKVAAQHAIEHERDVREGVA